MNSCIAQRYDFVYFFDVREGNPNGDPDAGNLPRVDPETGHGLVTDVALKRRIRNYVSLARTDEPRYDIYVREKAVLNLQHKRAYTACDLDITPKKLPKEEADALRLRQWMCNNFFDIRTFGAVMTTEVNCGQVRGPVQFTFARSVDPIVTLEHSITRMAVTTEREALEQQGDNRTMGRKYTVPYALYRMHGFVSAPLAEQTGFSDDDLSLLWEALLNMFDHDRSATRGEVTGRRLLVFKHDSRLGSAPAHELFDRITATRSSDGLPARSIADYDISVDVHSLPSGVELLELR